MRKAVLIAAVLVAILAVVAAYPSYVPKPVKDASGPLAVRLDAGVPAPEYHSPLAEWRLRHMDVIDRGELREADCLHCHVPARSCNSCHEYVGVKRISP